MAVSKVINGYQNPRDGGGPIYGYKSSVTGQVYNTQSEANFADSVSSISNAENWTPTSGSSLPENVVKAVTSNKGLVTYNGLEYTPTVRRDKDTGETIVTGIQATSPGDPWNSTRYTFDTSGNYNNQYVKEYTPDSGLGFFGDLLVNVGLPVIAGMIPGGTAFLSAASGNVNPLAVASSIAGIPGVSDAVGASTVSALQAANQTNNLVNAIESGNALGALASGTGLLGSIDSLTAPAVGSNSQLTPAQIESGLGTEGYGVGAQAQSSGLFDPAVIGSGAYTQTSYPIDMAEFAAADALQLINQGIGIPAVEQNLISSGLDPLIAADLTQQISLNPNLTSTDLANRLISTYGSNIYDTTINQINESAPKSTEPVPQVTSADINWGALAKGLVGLLGAGAVSQLASQPTAKYTSTPAYNPADTLPQYSPEYFQRVQQYYNTYLPSTPRDVATPLQDWYSSGYSQPDSITAKLFSGG